MTDAPDPTPAPAARPETARETPRWVIVLSLVNLAWILVGVLALGVPGDVALIGVALLTVPLFFVAMPAVTVPVALVIVAVCLVRAYVAGRATGDVGARFYRNGTAVLFVSLVCGLLYVPLAVLLG